ncbi:MAG: hypothetical protein COA79_26275 [Planctomycetota bacterium]|nr:MAG: hypothetical protein COA79_26275 [Planctomycetota bacterium]
MRAKPILYNAIMILILFCLNSSCKLRTVSADKISIINNIAYYKNTKRKFTGRVTFIDPITNVKFREAYFRKGLKHGKLFKWDKKGNKIFEGDYNKNKLISKIIWFWNLKMNLSHKKQDKFDQNGELIHVQRVVVHYFLNDILYKVDYIEDGALVNTDKIDPPQKAIIKYIDLRNNK